MLTAEDIAHRFSMAPHPEGGWYAETYRSSGRIPADVLPAGWGGHCFSTAILFLLKAGCISHLHRIRQDETWHFYLGGTLRLVMIYPDGSVKEVHLGQDILNGELVQYTVPAGCWFGAMPAENTDFSFIGCTVAPGFEFSDFELGSRKDLLKQYPALTALITEFTEPD